MQLNDTVNLDGIKQDIYFKGKITANSVPQNDLNRIINIYYKQLQAAIREINEDFFLVPAKTDLALFSSNAGTYTYPTDYEKVKSFWVALNPANIAAPLPSEFVRCNVIDVNAITDPTYTFNTPTIVTFGTYFALFPSLTDTTKFPVTLGMKIYYIQQQAALKNDADVPNIFSDYHDIISWGSLIDIAVRLGKPTLQKTAEETFVARLKEMKADASLRILDPERAIVEGQGNTGGWSYPFGNIHEM